MTLLFVDSFDHYNTAQAVRKWNVFSNTIGASGRFGSGMVLAGGSANSQAILTSSGATFVCGFAVNLAALSNAFVMGLFSGGSPQGWLILSDAGVPGRLSWYRGDVAAKLCDSSVNLKLSAWYYVEVKVVLSTTVGTVTIRVNGQVVATFAGNTQGAAGAVWDTVTFGGTAGHPIGALATIDDLVICDGAGTRNNDLLGDVRVQALLPTGAGNYSEFPTLVGAATQWQATADNPADDDTSYIASATAGQRSTFATADLASSGGTVAGLIIQTEARKDDAGVRTVAGMARSAAVDAAGAGASVGNSYQIFPTVMETDPSAAAWTIASVNAAEFGVKEIA